MTFDLPKALDTLAEKVQKEPSYLKHLEKALNPTAYRALLAWVELNKSQKILADSIYINTDNPNGLKKFSDAMIRVTSIHEQVGAEISSLAETK